MSKNEKRKKNEKHKKRRMGNEKRYTKIIKIKNYSKNGNPFNKRKNNKKEEISSKNKNHFLN